MFVGVALEVEVEVEVDVGVELELEVEVDVGVELELVVYVEVALLLDETLLLIKANVLISLYCPPLNDLDEGSLEIDERERRTHWRKKKIIRLGFADDQVMLLRVRTLKRLK